MQADLFPQSARPGSPLEAAMYDEGSRMLLGFLKRLAAHLAPGGEGWLILPDFAELLGFRARICWRRSKPVA